ncbi:nucleoside recognition domain-containing protein [Anaerocaecibacter muris]|uniref:nucleoside recognition domain-containing protein n=1 Tax=Anaerocaecibacter muris TaxID=2941513 RepID=UPI00204163E2|nr:nucleoside recognition domain-containing protein [Anaerocaecibacter muris]
MSAYIIPILFLVVLLLSFVRRREPYGGFIDGARQAVDLTINVFPYLLAVMVAVEAFRVSGASAYLANAIEPALRSVGLPKELAELLFLRPVSGAGSLAVLDGIYTNYGADSYIGRCASVIYGSSETVFYISTIYFSQSRVRRLRYAIPVALVATYTGCIVGCFLLKFF